MRFTFQENNVIIALSDCKPFDLVRPVDRGKPSDFVALVVGEARNYNGNIPILFHDGSGGIRLPDFLVTRVGRLKWEQ